MAGRGGRAEVRAHRDRRPYRAGCKTVADEMRDQDKRVRAAGSRAALRNPDGAEHHEPTAAGSWHVSRTGCRQFMQAARGWANAGGERVTDTSGERVRGELR